MKMTIPVRRHGYCLLVLFLVTFAIFPSATRAQSGDAAALKIQGKTLVDAQKFTEALPVYEKLAKLLPNDPEVFRNLGFSLMGQALNTEDPAARKKLRVRAREAYVRAKELGDDSLLVKGLIDGIPPDGGTSEGYSDNAEANKLMQKAEAAFSSGRLEDAFRLYQEALALDPRCYYAALFSGDVKTQTQKYNEAEQWYQRAIAIDPYVETAYRYSATPLMKQQKYDLARDRYIEAFIVAPYNRLAMSGIVGWGQVTNTPLGHPRIDIPEVKYDAAGKPTTVMNENALTEASKAWIAYSLTRNAWHKEKFAKTFPSEKQYRHTLQEEAEALRSVLKMAKEQKLTDPQLDVLQKLDNDGVLEAFVLIAIPDQGIAMDHAAYLRTNRDKLRKYVVDYVIGVK